MRREDVVFLEVAHVVAAHEAGLREAGGADGLRDAGLLHSAVMAPRIGYYQSLAELAAAYAFGVAKNHAFIDANKRTALLSAAVFLGVNGYPLQLDTAEWLSLIEGIADGSVSREALIDGFTRAMGGDPVELDE